MQFHDQDDIDDEAGSHIVMEQTGSGTVTYTVSFSGSISTASSVVSGVSGHVAISPDTRYGSISSSLGTTYQKVTDNSGNVSRVADTIKGDTLTQTTAIPDPGACEQITYTANAIGAWNSNSTWLLHVASVDTDGALLNDYIVDGTNQASSGTFSSPGAVGIFWFPYFNQFDDGIYGNVTNFIFATGGSNQEHVKMTLTDGSDGSIYGFNYYLIFHQPIEGTWTQNGDSFLLPTQLGPQSGSGNAGNSVTATNPSPTGDYSDPEQLLSGILAASSCLVVTENPVITRSLQALMTAASCTWNYEASQPAPGTISVTGADTQFQQDLSDQYSIDNDGVASSGPTDLDKMARFADTSLADSIYVHGNYEQAFDGEMTTGASPAQYYSFSFDVTRWVTRNQTNWVADGYNSTGYYGQAQGVTTKIGAYGNLFYWTDTTSSTPPTNSPS
jgi:hypothetical protein